MSLSWVFVAFFLFHCTFKNMKMIQWYFLISDNHSWSQSQSQSWWHAHIYKSFAIDVWFSSQLLSNIHCWLNVGQQLPYWTTPKPHGGPGTETVWCRVCCCSWEEHLRSKQTCHWVVTVFLNLLLQIQHVILIPPIEPSLLLFVLQS